MMEKMYFPEEKLGYDKELVDDYISKLSKAYQVAYEENQMITSKYESLLEDYKQTKELDPDKQYNEILAKTLMDAEIYAQIIRDSAYIEAADTKLKAQQILDDANNEVSALKVVSEDIVNNANSMASVLQTHAQKEAEDIIEEAQGMLRDAEHIKAEAEKIVKDAFDKALEADSLKTEALQIIEDAKRTTTEALEQVKKLKLDAYKEKAKAVIEAQEIVASANTEAADIIIEAQKMHRKRESSEKKGIFKKIQKIHANPVPAPTPTPLAVTMAASDATSVPADEAIAKLTAKLKNKVTADIPSFKSVMAG